jgi:FkbM family methyltransferase
MRGGAHYLSRTSRLILRLCFLLGWKRTVRVSVRPTRTKLRIRPWTTALLVLEQVRGKREYDLPLAAAPALVIDAGANVGITTSFFAQTFPAAQVVAIEPERENFDLLRRNVGSLANVSAVHAALWSGATAQQIVDPGIGPWRFQVRPAEDAPDEGAVAQGLSVDDVLGRFESRGPLLLKMDIEGAEREMLSTSSAWIDRVDVLAIELHDRYWAECTQAFEAATRDFAAKQVSGELTVAYRSAGLLRGPNGATD